MSENIEESSKIQILNLTKKSKPQKDYSIEIEIFSSFIKQTEETFNSEIKSKSDIHYDTLVHDRLKYLILEVEKNLKNLQKIQQKPDLRNEVVTNKSILSYLNENFNNTENIKDLIKIFQKKLLEIKASSLLQTDVQNYNKKYIYELYDTKFSKSVIALFENLSSENEFQVSGKENFIYLILIFPGDHVGYLFTSDKNIFLNYNQINTLLSNNRLDFLKSLLGLSLENYLEEIDFNFELNLQKLFAEASVIETVDISYLVNEIRKIKDKNTNQDSIRSIKNLDEFDSAPILKFKTIQVDVNIYSSITITNIRKEKFSECQIFTNNVKGFKKYLEGNSSLDKNPNENYSIIKLF